MQDLVFPVSFLRLRVDDLNQAANLRFKVWVQRQSPTFTSKNRLCPRVQDLTFLHEQREDHNHCKVRVRE